MWTSGAHFAHWIILLVRTNPDVPKHQGISCLLVPMTTPGVTVRPLVLMTGHHHFNEVFFTDVVVPKANLLGPINQGWKVSTTTLMYERHSAGGRSHTAQIARLIALARRVPIDGRPAWDHPWIRQRLAQLAIDSEALKYTRLRSLTRQLRGEPPGPEGSVLKLSGSELGVRIADVAGELLGMHVLVNQGSDERARRASLVQPRARRAPVHDLGGNERDPAQHHRRARPRATAGLSRVRVTRRAGPAWARRVARRGGSIAPIAVGRFRVPTCRPALAPADWRVSEAMLDGAAPSRQDPPRPTRARPGAYPSPAQDGRESRKSSRTRSNAAG